MAFQILQAVTSQGGMGSFDKKIDAKISNGLTLNIIWMNY